MDPDWSAQGRLIGDIYAAATNPQGWSAVLRGIVDALDGRSARLLVLNPQGDTVRHSVRVNHDDGYHAQYVAHFVNLCPWRTELAVKPRGRLYSTFLDFSCDQDGFRRSEFYNDWARPQGIEHGLCGVVHADRAQQVQLLVQRTREPGHFDRQAQRFVNELVPHIERSIMLSRLLGERDMFAVAAALLPDHPALLLLDENLKTTFVSASAEALLAGTPAMALTQGRLRARRVDVDQRLQCLLLECRRTAQADGRSPGGTLSCGGGLRVEVMPITPTTDHALLRDRLAVVAVSLSVIHEAADSWQAWGLSPRERELANALVAGQSLADYATARGITRETARSQLKSLFNKTGTHRQHELVALLMRGAGNSHPGGKPGDRSRE